MRRFGLSAPGNPEDRGYDSVYEDFDSPLMKQLRAEAYEDDIGQHSWVTAAELRHDVSDLRLSRASRLLDLGCGPGGPLTFVVGLAQCRGTGLEVSAPAIAAARTRAVSLGLDQLVTFYEADLNEPIALADDSFDAAMSLDVVLHLRDREQTFREVARLLAPGGRLLFTDAGVVTGSVSDEEARLRSLHGATRFVRPGFNERALEVAGFRLVQVEDRTAGLLRNATGRLSARLAHRSDLEPVEGAHYFDRQRQYLETVVKLADRGAMARIMYLAGRQV